MRSNYFILLALAIGAISILFTGTVIAGGKWSAKGTFVEGCSCNPPCACELTGVEMGCQGVGAMEFTGGSYMGTDLTGAKITYATTPGQWVRIYVDAKDDKQKEAATAFAKDYYKGFGPVEASSAAKIDISGKNGRYTVKVDDGKIMTLVTEPILGGDGKTPLVHKNTKSKLVVDFKQGKTVSGMFSDGERKFELKSSNSYFNDKVKSEGTLE
ncbi:MAG: DUF1326 domain-containing protein [Ignavibacteriae bacterium]|nr:DUF1326 domain-containing protein [Ignavibacteriota bacterium]